MYACMHFTPSAIEHFAKAEGAYHLPDTRYDISSLMTVMMPGLSCRLPQPILLHLLQLRPNNLHASNG